MFMSNEGKACLWSLPSSGMKCKDCLNYQFPSWLAISRVVYKSRLQALLDMMNISAICVLCIDSMVNSLDRKSVV